MDCDIRFRNPYSYQIEVYGRFVNIDARNKKHALEIFMKTWRDYYCFKDYSELTLDDITNITRTSIAPLCGYRWYWKHRGEHSDFIPSIEIIYNSTILKFENKIPKEAKILLRDVHKK